MGSALNLLAVGMMLLLFFGTPVVCLILLYRNREGPFPWRRRALLGVSGSVLLTWLTLVGGYVVHVGPWRSGILCQGVSPEGQEYFAVQTFKGFIEPYQVSFYIRDARGVWQWHALGHDDDAWRGIAVKFTPEAIVVTHTGSYRREIPRRGTGIHQDSETYNQPAKLSAAEVAELHQREYR